MRVHRRVVAALCGIAVSAGMSSTGTAQSSPRITIISDAFSDDDALELDWGFAALIEYDGKRILFDTGNNAERFARNVGRLGIDLTHLEFVVISHRHGDHTDGLRHVLAVNPDVKIYAANDEYFGGPTPPVFFNRPVPSLPVHMRYFNGNVPADIPHGSPWRANIQRVTTITEIAPGIRVVNNRAGSGAFTETPEVSLVLDTPDGQVVTAGCSHPGIEQILESIEARTKPVSMIVGGFHLVNASDLAVDRLVHALLDEWKVGGVAPGHCTGEYAFDTLRRAYGRNYHYAGAGTVLELSGRRVP
jgi:7,8-dihydropterin-6-yl-methyl-4-(beta-D-ribofuranosyl)aminobenzene 5'-phosphate synthase